MNLKKLYFLLLLPVLSGLRADAQVTLSQTNLPIIVINSTVAIGATHVQADFKIISNTTGLNTPADLPAYQGKIGISVRGSSGNPKESYNVETWTNVFNISLDTALLGMPSENDWVLIANYTDRSLMRDLLGFHIFEQMGYYATRMRLCEVIINNNYQGVYLFGERIKRDKNRVDIAKLKLSDAAGLNLTGGYIFKIESSNAGYWTSNYAPPYASSTQDIKFHYDEPAPGDITGVQKSYIQSYTDSFETALQGPGFQDTLTGWRAHGAHKSFKDYMIFNEFMRSADAYRVGTYLYKDKGKKLRIGPPWDLELSLYNTADCNSASDTGWAYQYGMYCGGNDYLPPFWWQRLATDTLFMRELKCRYTELRATVLDSANMFHFMDSISTMVNAQQAQNRNFQQWPVFGVSLVNEPLLAANYSDELNNMKGFIRRRLQFLDSKWLSTDCSTTGIGAISLSGATISVYPNPVSDLLIADINLTKATDVAIAVRDIYGNTVLQKNYGKLLTGSHLLQNDLHQLVPGVYIATISVDRSTKAIKLIKE